MVCYVFVAKYLFLFVLEFYGVFLVVERFVLYANFIAHSSFLILAILSEQATVKCSKQQ